MKRGKTGDSKKHLSAKRFEVRKMSMVVPLLVNYFLQYNNKRTSILCGHSLVDEVNHMNMVVSFSLLCFSCLFLLHDDAVKNAI